MNNEGIIRNVVGALVSIKVLETGSKIIMRQQKKIKGNGLFSTKKKNDWF